MGLLNYLLFGKSDIESENNNNEQEIKRLKNLGLDDEEIRLVQEEICDETSFEEESDGNYEDDDYYSEDDFYEDNDKSDDEEDEDDEWV